MSDPGYIDVPVRPQVDGSFGQKLEKDLDGPLGRIRGKIGQVGKMLAVGLAAGVAGAAVGLYKLGESFDDAYDTIRVGTGATGDALEDLKEDFRDVVASVPTDFGSASTAIADLNTRLGLTGKPLRDVSKRILELSRITDTDVSTNVETASRAFGDWSISTEHQADALDKLFRASQATGPSVDAIATSLVKYGSPLRQLGFSFDEAAALIGKFEKEGVNTSLVLGSMRQALGKMAREGEPAVETFRRVTGEIENAGSASEANALALELFGARAGPDMASAIREGRFELGDLLDTVAGGSETILGAAADTADFAESWTLFKNRVLLLLEPIAIRVFDALGTAMDRVGPPLTELMGGIRAFFAAFRAGDGDVTSSGFAGRMEEIANRLRPLWDRLTATIRELAPIVRDVLVGALRTLWNVLSSLVGVVQRNATLFRTLGVIVAGAAAGFVALLIVDKMVRIFRAARAAVLAFNAVLAANPIILVSLAIGALIAGLVLAYRRFEGFRNVVDAVGRFIRDVFSKALSYFTSTILPALQDGLRTAWSVLQSIASFLVTTGSAAWNTISSVIRTVVDWLSANVFPIFVELGELVRAVFDRVRSIVSTVFPIVANIVSTYVGIIRGVLSWLWTTFGPLVRGALSAVSSIFSSVFGAIRSIVSGVFTAIRGIIEGALRVIRGVIQVVTGIIRGDWSRVWNGIRSIVSGVVGAITGVVRGAFNGLAGIVRSALNGVRNVVTSVWDGIIGFFRGIGGKIASATRGMWDGISGAFKSAINWIIDKWNGLRFTLPKVEFLGQTIGGNSIGVPRIPRLATGGMATSPGLAIVGDGGNGSGTELLALPRGAGVVPLDVAAMIAGAALAGRRHQDGTFRDLVVVEPAATADEIAETVDRRLSWKASIPGVGGEA